MSAASRRIVRRFKIITRRSSNRHSLGRNRNAVALLMLSNNENPYAPPKSDLLLRASENASSNRRIPLGSRIVLGIDFFACFAVLIASLAFLGISLAAWVETSPLWRNGQAGQFPFDSWRHRVVMAVSTILVVAGSCGVYGNAFLLFHRPHGLRPTRMRILLVGCILAAFAFYYLVGGWNKGLDRDVIEGLATVVLLSIGWGVHLTAFLFAKRSLTAAPREIPENEENAK